MAEESVPRDVHSDEMGTSEAVLTLVPSYRSRITLPPPEASREWPLGR